MGHFTCVYLVANFGRCATSYRIRTALWRYRTNRMRIPASTIPPQTNITSFINAPLPVFVSTDQSDNAHLRRPPHQTAASPIKPSHPTTFPPSPPQPQPNHPHSFTHHIMSSSKKSSSSSSRKSRSHDPIYESGYSSSSSRSYGTTYSSMSPFWTIGTLLGASSVALGAFGAHGLKSRIRDPALLANWGTAAQYQVCAICSCLARVWAGVCHRCGVSNERVLLCRGWLCFAEIESGSSLCVTAVPVD